MKNSKPINTVLITFLCMAATMAAFQQANGQPGKSQYASGDSWIDKNENENYTARHECSFVQAGDKFIMFGGRESAQRLDIYDYKTDTWSTGSMAPKEFNHFQATTHQGFVWVIGAFKTNNFPREIPEENIWLYHPPSDKWIKGPEIPEDRRRGGAGLVVYEDKFYVVGGNTIGHDGGYVDWFDEYDPQKNTWKRLESASQQRDHFYAAIMDNKLFAAGGRKSGGEGGVFSPLPAIVDVFDYKTNSWSTLDTNLPTPRAAPGIAVFNNELLVMGGEGEEKGPAYKIVEAYNPKTKAWTQKPDMHYTRHGTQAILSGKGVYIAGGSPNRGGGRQLNMEVYGEDAPDGITLVASKLEAPKEVLMKAGSTKNFKIKNAGGNTGSFISEISISDPGSAQFKLTTNYNLRLVNANESIALQVEHSGQSQSAAQMKIIYNGDSELVINLRSY